MTQLAKIEVLPHVSIPGEYSTFPNNSCLRSWGSLGKDNQEFGYKCQPKKAKSK